ncbi:MAG: response regulator transcription factor [Gammaproteobacteria bacterium]
MKVLIAEDDRLIRQGLNDLLSGEGYTVIESSDGQDALARYESERPDFVLLDIMMPGMDGYAVCREIRRKDEQTPVIFISAKSEEIDRVLGLELGADDYIMKPFGSREVIARMRAVTRRLLAGKAPADDDNAPFQMDDLSINPRELRAQRGDELMDLSLRDLRILRALWQYPGEVLDRDALFNAAWGRDYLPSSRTLDQHVSKLRKRIELDAKAPRIIQTVHGVGYRFPG